MRPQAADTLVDAVQGAPAGLAAAALEVVDEAAHWCYGCETSFKSAPALRMHSKIKHGLRAAVLAAVHDTGVGCHCVACLVDLHTVDKLLQHLKAAGCRCGSLVGEHVAPASPGGIEALRKRTRAEEKIRRTARRRPPPATRLLGPLQLWACV